MHRLRALALVGVVVGAAFVPSTASAPHTAAAPPPCSEEPRENPISEFTGYDELLVELDRIERVSRGRVAVEEVGTSNRGRGMMLARVGTGPKVVFITAEIHGNEKTGPDALLDVVDYLGTSDSTAARQIRDRLTVVAMPKINPDAASLDRRGNDMTWQEAQARFPQLAASPPPWNYITDQRQGDDYSQRPGFDVNRDYHPDLDYRPQPQDFPGSSDEPGWFISPETQTVRDVYKRLRAEFGAVDTYVDLHHQGACYTVPGTDDFVTMSLSGKFVADPRTPEGAAFAEFGDTFRPEYSRQLNVAAYNALQDAADRNPDFGHITLYPQDINLPGTGLGAFQLNGSGAVLFEVRGQTQTLGEQHRETLTQTVHIGLDGILSSIASGEVARIDPAEYDRIPPTDRGERTLSGPTGIEG
ncbi:M14 family zinc carboxypeptidase [Saccharopolyspora flava]|uniref:Zinc carboxypeptidase n=1 Tax=Saccharopolyspora flava TaxID=95161 RepID=A0A1I6PGL8_9PSEU|nr:M14 family zinc carboxypeptidase [Saccharopolyspora flava]SFS39371.1 Zinc carboxypeptidase [Saccharopolyspora flava]